LDDQFNPKCTLHANAVDDRTSMHANMGAAGDVEASNRMAQDAAGPDTGMLVDAPSGKDTAVSFDALFVRTPTVHSAQEHERETAAALARAASERYGSDTMSCGVAGHDTGMLVDVPSGQDTAAEHGAFSGLFVRTPTVPSAQEHEKMSSRVEGGAGIFGGAMFVRTLS
jgi:hypothetical protein